MSPKLSFMHPVYKWKTCNRLQVKAFAGAHIRGRTGDLRLTKATLYLLSYVGMVAGTGFEPATFGL